MRINKYIPYFKQILQIAIPIMIAQAGAQLTNMVDTIMVGNVSSVHLAASSIANYIFLIPFLFGLGLSNAITPLVGEANGKGDLKKCRSLFVNSIYYNILNGIAITLILLLLGLLIPYLQMDKATIDLAIPYYNLLTLSVLPFIMFFGIKQYIDGFGFTVFGMIATIFGNLINVFLNWVLIFGNLGFPALELNGAGIATLISRITSLLFIFGVLFFAPKLKNKIKMPSIKFCSIKKIHQLFKLGVNIGFQMSLEMSSFSFLMILAGWLGTTALASYQIMMSIASLAYLSVTGIGAAATVLISTYSGEKNVRKIIEGSKAIVFITVIFMLASAIAMVLVRNIAPNLYVNDAAVLKIAPTLLLMAALYQIPDGVLVAFVGVMRGLFDVKMPAVIQTISYWGIMIPLAFILSFTLGLGALGIALSLVVGITLCCCIMYFRYRQTLHKYMHKHKRIQHIS